MLKKFLAVLVVLLVFISTYAKSESPSKDFPYDFDYYPQCKFLSYRSFCGKKQTDVGQEASYFVNQWSERHCLVLKYEIDEMPAYKDLKGTLQYSIPAIKTFDKKIDEEYGQNYEFFFFFVDSDGCVFGVATFKENIKAKRPWSFHDLNPFKND